MKEVIAKAMELVIVLEAEVKSNELLHNQLNAGIAECKSKKEYLDAKELDLSNREAEIKKIEDVKALYNEAVAKENKLKDEYAEFNIRKTAFLAHENQATIDIQTKGIELNAVKESLDARAKNLNEMKEALDAEKETYRATILEEIKSRL